MTPGSMAARSRHFRALWRRMNPASWGKAGQHSSREGLAMSRKSQSKSARLTRRTFAAGVGAAGFVAGTAPFNILRAQGGALKVGVLLPRSGYQAGIGQDCQRGANIAPAILKSMGLPDLTPHERRHRDQRRHRARARREADRRGRATPGRRLRFRPDHRDRAGRRAEGHPLRHQYRRGARHHRAGLQVRVPEFSHRRR